MRKQLIVAAVVALGVLSGCAKSVPGTVAMTTEPLAVDTLTCAQYSDLNDVDKAQAVHDILKGDKSAFGIDQPLALVLLADVMCKQLPDMKLRKVLLGGSG